MPRFDVIYGRDENGNQTRQEVPWSPEREAAQDAAEAAAAAAPRPVRKLLILDRLHSAGKFDAAMAALGGPGDLAYERWQAAQYVMSDDADVIALLTAIGADPAAILAPE